MYDGTYYTLTAEYNAWMNERLYDVCGQLSDEERTQDHGTFFKSTHNMFDHILWGDPAWMSRTGKGPGDIDIPRLAALWADGEMPAHDGS